MTKAFHRLAIYDMDKTITRRATWTPFLSHALRHHAPWRAALLPVPGLATLLFLGGAIDRARLKEISQRALIGPIDRHALARLGEGFAEETLANNVHPAALARIAEDRAAGYRLVLATASARFYAAPIAARLGFDDVVATDNRLGRDGRVSAGIAGGNNYGPAKLRLVERWLAAEGLRRAECFVRFYSDHASDAPVLEWADEPFAVNPHDRLRALAGERGWPVLEWGARADDVGPRDGK